MVYGLWESLISEIVKSEVIFLAERWLCPR